MSEPAAQDPQAPLAAGSFPPERLLPHRVRLVRRQIPSAIFGNLITVAAIVLVYWNAVPRTHLVWWAVVSVAIVLLRLAVPFPKGAPAADAKALRAWSRVYGVCTFAAGAIWGYIPLVFFSSLGESHQVFFAFLAGGLTAGAAISYAPILWLGPSYYLPILVPLAVRFLAGEGGVVVAMGWMITFFTIFMVAIQRNMYRSTTQAIILGIQNTDLVAYLSEANRQAERLNEELRLQIGQTRAEEQARAEVEAREERLRAMAEATPTALFLVGQEDSLVRFGNGRFKEMFGFDPLAGQPPTVQQLFSNPADVERHIIQIKKTGRAQDDQVLMRTAQGHTFWGLLSCQALSDTNDPGVLCGVVDITERLALEQQLRQSQKMEAMGQLAGGMAHDFNNNLQVIRGYADILSKAPHLDSETRLDLEKILRAVEGASALTGRLLAFSRDQILLRVRVDPNELIGELGKLLHPLLGADIELQVRPGSAVPTVLADRAMLEQVLLNLCVNAREAMPDGGELTIATDVVTPGAELKQRLPEVEDAPYVRITVSDPGRGMPPEVLEHIFEPFYTTKPAGSGLGLSTAYGIVRQHRGFIDVASTPGKGTAFHVYLPASAGAAEMLPAVEEGTSQGGPELILVAEDDEDVRKLVERLLRARGYRVLLAENGEQAMALFMEHQAEIQLALLDVVMPRQGGVETFEQMRALRSDLPVIFCTAYTGRVLDDKYLARPAVAVLKKPYLPAHLFKAVRTMLDGA